MAATIMDASSIATRLCSACGLCCNGVMFHTVRLQPSDSPQELIARGLRPKRKKGASFLLQPCPAFCGSHCGIYEARPERCRRFECRQLKRAVAGEITEEVALDRIREVQRRVEELNGLLDRSGRTDVRKPLSKRYEKITAVPVHASEGADAVELREKLERAFLELDAILDGEFRVAGEKAEADEMVLKLPQGD